MNDDLSPHAPVPVPVKSCCACFLPFTPDELAELDADELGDGRHRASCPRCGAPLTWDPDGIDELRDTIPLSAYVGMYPT